MPSKPSGFVVVLCAVLAACAMALGVYFGGQNRMPLAMLCTTVFVLLGGTAFELARRRSM